MAFYEKQLFNINPDATRANVEFGKSLQELARGYEAEKQAEKEAENNALALLDLRRNFEATTGMSSQGLDPKTMLSLYAHKGGKVFELQNDLRRDNNAHQNAMDKQRDAQLFDLRRDNNAHRNNLQRDNNQLFLDLKRDNNAHSNAMAKQWDAQLFDLKRDNNAHKNEMGRRVFDLQNRNHTEIVSNSDGTSTTTHKVFDRVIPLTPKPESAWRMNEVKARDLENAKKLKEKPLSAQSASSVRVPNNLSDLYTREKIFKDL